MAPPLLADRAPQRIMRGLVDTGRPPHYAELAGFFGTELRHHFLAAYYLSTWYPGRAEERRAYLAKLDTSSPFWLGAPDADAG